MCLLAVLPALTCFQASAATITFTTLQDWGTGMQGQIEIANTDSSPIDEWSLQFDFGGQISSIYNATIVSHTGHTYDAAAASFNSTIPGHGDVTFGFTASPGGNVADNFVLQQKNSPPPAPPSPTVHFVDTSDYGTGMVGQINIDNPGTAAFTNWSLQFNLDGSISSVFGATLTSHTGHTYDVVSAGYNGSIPGGGEVSFGFVASPGGIVANEFVLKGSYAGAPTPAGVPEPSYAAAAGLLLLAGVVFAGHGRQS